MATSLPNPNCTTVPRKRRPKTAAGDITIASSSSVYLNGDSNDINTKNHIENVYEQLPCRSSGPIYQNTDSETSSSEVHSDNTNRLKSLRRNYGFSSLRYCKGSDDPSQSVITFVGKFLHQSFCRMNLEQFRLKINNYKNPVFDIRI